MPFDPNILLQAAELMSQRRGQNLQYRLGRPSFNRTLGQSFASGLGEAPGRALAALPGEFFASARQDASFAHEGAMEDIRNPMMPVDPTLFGQPGFPEAQGSVYGLTPALSPQAPQMMRAKAIEAAMQMNRPRFEREIEQFRHGNEMEQIRLQGENARLLEAARNRVNIPGRMAGDLGLANPTGFVPVGGGGFQYPDEVAVDAEALRAGVGMRQIGETSKNTEALNQIRADEAESKKSKREIDAEHAARKLELGEKDLGIKRERLDLDTKAFEETKRVNAAKERASKVEGNATTLRAARADATREILAAEKAVNDPNAFMRTPEQQTALENKVKELKAYRSELDNRLDTLDKPATETKPDAPAPATETIEEKMARLRKRLEGG